jgi:hypothetical protein
MYFFIKLSLTRLFFLSPFNFVRRQLTDQTFFEWKETENSAKGHFKRNAKIFGANLILPKYITTEDLQG